MWDPKFQNKFSNQCFDASSQVKEKDEKKKRWSERGEGRAFILVGLKQTKKEKEIITLPVYSPYIKSDSATLLWKKILSTKTWQKL